MLFSVLYKVYIYFIFTFLLAKLKALRPHNQNDVVANGQYITAHESLYRCLANYIWPIKHANFTLD